MTYNTNILQFFLWTVFFVFIFSYIAFLFKCIMAEFKVTNFAVLQRDFSRFLNHETKIIETLGNGAFGTVQKVLYNNEEKVVKVLKFNDWDLSGKKFI